jgi:hypothetical protein
MAKKVEYRALTLFAGNGDGGFGGREEGPWRGSYKEAFRDKEGAEKKENGYWLTHFIEARER